MPCQESVLDCRVAVRCMPNAPPQTMALNMGSLDRHRECHAVGVDLADPNGVSASQLKTKSDQLTHKHHPANADRHDDSGGDPGKRPLRSIVLDVATWCRPRAPISLARRRLVLPMGMTQGPEWTQRRREGGRRTPNNPGRLLGLTIGSSCAARWPRSFLTPFTGRYVARSETHGDTTQGPEPIDVGPHAICPPLMLWAPWELRVTPVPR
jgi:hypothetical protein